MIMLDNCLLIRELCCCYIIIIIINYFFVLVNFSQLLIILLTFNYAYLLLLLLLLLLLFLLSLISIFSLFINVYLLIPSIAIISKTGEKSVCYFIFHSFWFCYAFVYKFQFVSLKIKCILLIFV